MNSYDFVIFDMDGTLVDSLDAHVVMFNRFWKSCPENTGVAEPFFAGQGPTIWDVFRVAGIKEEQMPKIYAELDSFYRAGCDDIIEKLVFTKGAFPCLKAFREAGVKTALISNSHTTLVKEVVKANNAVALFDVISGSTADEPDKRHRMRNVMKKMGEARERTLYVGDNESDGRTAHAVGVDGCIILSSMAWVKSMDELMCDVKPAYTIYSLDCLQKIVL